MKVGVVLAGVETGRIWCKGCSGRINGVEFPVTNTTH